MSRWSRTAAAAPLVALLLSGCGGNPKTAPVRGRVTLGGKPIGPGDILFAPDAAQGTRGKPAVGRFEADGLYTLSTYREGDGAVVGRHHVVITPRPAGAAPGSEFSAKDATLPPIPPKYSDAARPLLTAEVKPGSPEIHFDLTP